jgi:hypothetical protein
MGLAKSIVKEAAKISACRFGGGSNNGVMAAK